jgi:hypothetical protein
MTQTWKEMVVRYFRTLFGHSAEETDESHENLSKFNSADILIAYFPNTGPCLKPKQAARCLE